MDGYSASAEPVTGYAIRVHPNPGGKYGDDYEAGCLVATDGTTALVKMLLGKITVPGRRAVDDVLRDLGFKRMYYERRRNGRVIRFEKDL